MNLRYTIKAPKDTRKVLWRNMVNVLGLTGTLLILIYPWFLPLSAARIIPGIACAMIAWIMLLSILQSLFPAQAENKLNAGAIIVLILLFSVAAVAALLILKLVELKMT